MNSLSTLRVRLLVEGLDQRILLSCSLDTLSSSPPKAPQGTDTVALLQSSICAADQVPPLQSQNPAFFPSDPSILDKGKGLPPGGAAVVRKNQSTLTAQERKEFVDAVLQLKHTFRAGSDISI